MNMQPTVFIVDDDETIHEVINGYLENFLNFQVTIVSHLAAADFLTDPQRSLVEWGCLLLDNRMPQMTGTELLELLRIQQCSLPIIMMTSQANISLAVQEMKKGLFYFVEKPFDSNKLVGVVRQALLEYHRYSRPILPPPELLGRLKALTGREWTVLEKMMAGKVNKVIADELQVSCKTVEKHRAKLMKKMQVHSIAELVRLVNQSRC